MSSTARPDSAPPEVERQIELSGQPVAYRLRRSRRRTIGLAIDQRGFRVSAPLRARQGDIENLIRQHSQWVLDKLAAWREQPPPAPLTVVDGSIINILGQPLPITVTPVSRARWRWQDDAHFYRLHLYPSPAADACALLEKALRERARRVFAERLACYAPLLGLPPPPLRLSSARARWGSCNARGGVALNWRLMFLPLPLVDYVVCHELAHLREMNHSPRFWAVVEQLCPDWRTRRQALRAVKINP